MNRRGFLFGACVAPLTVFWRAANASIVDYRRVLVLVELKGGNDGLNTVIPFADDEYYRLRPKLAIPRDQSLQIADRVALHPSLQPLVASWQANEVAIVQGVGYPNPNLSHFRSIEIWDGATASDVYADEGWLARMFTQHPVSADFAADCVVIGDGELGPFAGERARAIALNNTEQFSRPARLARSTGTSSNAALDHIIKVESDIVQAAERLHGAPFTLKAEFPKSAIGTGLKTVTQIIAGRTGIAAIKVSHGSFDTHTNQPGQHARLLAE